MRSGGIALLVWAGIMSVFLAVLWGIFSTEALQVGLLGGSTATVALVGILTLLRRRSAPEGDLELERPVPELSVATAWTAFWFVGVLVGFTFGSWLNIISGGMLVIGVLGLLREFVSAPGGRLQEAGERRRTATPAEGGAARVADGGPPAVSDRGPARAAR